MFVNFLCGNGLNYYGNRFGDFSVIVIVVGRNYWILYYLFLFKIYMGDLENILIKVFFEKVKRIVIYFNNWEDLI